jgi:hypothetical protein
MSIREERRNLQNEESYDLYVAFTKYCGDEIIFVC